MAEGDYDEVDLYCYNCGQPTSNPDSLCSDPCREEFRMALAEQQADDLDAEAAYEEYVADEERKVDAAVMRAADREE